MLAGLADYGGPTLTHALLPGSPAIDAGDPAFAAPPAFDQRGAPFARVFGGRIDIGGFEVQTLSLVVDTDVDESDGDYTPGDLSLREAIELANINAGPDLMTYHGEHLIEVFVTSSPVPARLPEPGSCHLSCSPLHRSPVRYGLAHPPNTLAWARSRTSDG